MREGLNVDIKIYSSDEFTLKRFWLIKISLTDITLYAPQKFMLIIIFIESLLHSDVIINVETIKK